MFRRAYSSAFQLLPLFRKFLSLFGERPSGTSTREPSSKDLVDCDASRSAPSETVLKLDLVNEAAPLKWQRRRRLLSSE